MQHEAVRPDHVQGPHVGKALQPVRHGGAKGGIAGRQVGRHPQGIADANQREVDGLDGALGLLGQEAHDARDLALAGCRRLLIAPPRLGGREEADQHGEARKPHRARARSGGPSLTHTDFPNRDCAAQGFQGANPTVAR